MTKVFLVGLIAALFITPAYAQAPVANIQPEVVYTVVSPKEYAQNLTETTFGADQWDYVEMIVYKESGWNHTAQNPTSTAYGLFQFLDATWGNVGGEKTSDPYLQIEYGVKYIYKRYGTPELAWSFHRAHNWY